MIEKQRALVLVNQQGHENSREMAIKLAKEIGEFVEIDIWDFEGRFQGWMHIGIKTVIIHGVPSPQGIDSVKAMLTKKRFRVHRMNINTEIMATPNLIFCVDDKLRTDHLPEKFFRIMHIVVVENK